MSTSLLHYPPTGPRRCRGYESRLGRHVDCWRKAEGCEQCVTCAGSEERERRHRLAAERRRVERQKEQGFKDEAKGDPFEGFREGGDR